LLDFIGQYDEDDVKKSLQLLKRYSADDYPELISKKRML